VSAVVAGLFVFVTFLVISGMAYFNLHDTWTGPTATLKEAAGRQAERVETVVSIASAGPTASDCRGYTADVNNPGQTSVADFSKMDLIVNYPGSDGETHATNLEYVESIPTGNRWTLSSITPDTHHPNTWNPEEKATLLFHVSPAMKHTSSGLLTISTPLAVTDSTNFSCDLTHYFHSETTDINAVTYYQLKNTFPDGTATTITSTFTAGQTGRVSPTSNNGKFVFPLTGISEIPGSTWTVTYRVQRDPVELGFVWFTNAKALNFNQTNKWGDIDLLPLGVPAIATGAVVEVVNTSVDELRGMVRGTEDTRDYMADPDDGKIKKQNHRWQVVKIDDDTKIQGYVDDQKVDFMLLGYTIGADPTYFKTPPDVTPTTFGAWTPVDVSTFVQSDADGVILLIRSVDAFDRNYGIREVGSSYNTTSMKVGTFANTMYLVGLNASQQFDAWIENANVEIYLVAQTMGSVVYYVDDIAVADPPFNIWTQLDADDSPYLVDDAAVGLVFLLEAGAPKKIGLRHGDSTDDWNNKVEENHHIQGAVGLNIANRWYTFIENTTAQTYIAAYTRLVRMDVHADIDVLVRQSNGAIRSTLATNVANSFNITNSVWSTLTGTYSSPTYTVVDDTDYLEIDLFAEATTNTSGQIVSIDFRIDDPTLAIIDRARIDF